MSTNQKSESLEHLVKEVEPEDFKSKAKKLGLTSERFQEEMSDHAKSKIIESKLKDRTYFKLDDWHKSKYAKTNWCQLLKENCLENVSRAAYKDLSQDQFIEQFEKPNIPCVITGCSKEWPKDYWTVQNMYERYKDVEFKIGEDDDGHKLRCKFKYYLEYFIHNKDDSPLYLFESSIEDKKEAKEMLEHYSVPKYFDQDFFDNCGKDKRPPHRWFLMGSERSGTTLHQDPLMTSAWNTSFFGYKRWVFFPPHIPKMIVKGKKYKPVGEDDEAINYFAKILPKILEDEGRERLGCIEFIQKPGDTVYTPGGWWHAVMNVTDSMAITQNWMSYASFDRVWKAVRKDRKKFACYLLRKLERKDPQIADRAKILNKQDQYVMHDLKKKLLEKRQVSKEFKEDELYAYEILEKKRKFSDDSSSNSSSSSSSSDYDNDSSDNEKFNKKRTRSKSNESVSK